jgi:hypothetical protein
MSFHGRVADVIAGAEAELAAQRTTGSRKGRKADTKAARSVALRDERQLSGATVQGEVATPAAVIELTDRRRLPSAPSKAVEAPAAIPANPMPVAIDSDPALDLTIAQHIAAERSRLLNG